MWLNSEAVLNPYLTWCRSVDGLLNTRKRNAHVPLWNYAVLRGQVQGLRKEGGVLRQPLSAWRSHGRLHSALPP